MWMQQIITDAPGMFMMAQPTGKNHEDEPLERLAAGDHRKL
jgi:hypothetical protein